MNLRQDAWDILPYIFHTAVPLEIPEIAIQYLLRIVKRYVSRSLPWSHQEHMRYIIHTGTVEAIPERFEDFFGAWILPACYSYRNVAGNTRTVVKKTWSLPAIVHTAGNGQIPD